MMSFSRGRRGLSALTPLLFLALLLLARPATASIGDRLPEFKACLEVRSQPSPFPPLFTLCDIL